MAHLRIATATATELQAADAVWGYPAPGRNVGEGRHAEIPPDWAAQIAGGRTVAGVTTTQGADPDGAVTLPEDAKERLAEPETVQRIRERVGVTEADAFVAKVEALEPDPRLGAQINGTERVR